MTGHGSIESAVEAMKVRARYDYIQKPVSVWKNLRMLLRRMEEKKSGLVPREQKFLRERVETDQQLDGIIGRGPPRSVKGLANHRSTEKIRGPPVLICGERRERGKEIGGARRQSITGGRVLRRRPFVAVRLRSAGFRR